MSEKCEEEKWKRKSEREGRRRGEKRGGESEERVRRDNMILKLIGERSEPT